MLVGGVPSANAYAAVRLDISNGGTGRTIRVLLGNATGTGWTNTSMYSTTQLTGSVWYYLTLVRDGTLVTLYVNGVPEASITVSAGLTLYPGAGAFGYNWIGAKNTSSNIDGISVNQPVTGYVQDFRITKGIARYTANFSSTLPVRPLPAG